MAEETSCQVGPLFCCNVSGYVDPVYRNGMLLDSLHWCQILWVVSFDDWRCAYGVPDLSSAPSVYIV